MRTRGAVAVLVLLAVTLGLATLPRELVGPVTSPRASATPGASAFRAGFRPLLQRAVTQVETLVAMGEARERNLLRIHAEQNAMHEALSAADAWLAAHEPAPPDGPAIDAYRKGAAAVREAMREAQAGFLRLDFERVAAATETMRQGAAALRRASGLLGP